MANGDIHNTKYTVFAADIMTEASADMCQACSKYACLIHKHVYLKQLSCSQCASDTRRVHALDGAGRHPYSVTL